MRNQPTTGPQPAIDWKLLSKVALPRKNIGGHFIPTMSQKLLFFLVVGFLGGIIFLVGYIKKKGTFQRQPS